jgi:esterase/lipase superfamily enzyme
MVNNIKCTTKFLNFYLNLNCKVCSEILTIHVHVAIIMRIKVDNYYNSYCYLRSCASYSLGISCQWVVEGFQQILMICDC